ncbi:MAG: DNA polymerase I [Bacteroidaceae bacterium]|nr:DNA polymerase I [Bacteroidaceae bacterium]
MKLFLIDAYAIIYRSYYALIKNPRINSKGLNTSAIMGFCNTLNEVLQKENPTHIAVAFDPKGGTFRSEMFPEYKAQREQTPEDIRKSVPIIKDILRAMNIEILEVAGFEADDVIGTYATYAGKQGIETYMLTPDKDYGQLVMDNVRMYKPRHGGGYDILGPKEVCEKYGIQRTDQVIDLLGLMGDSADNIPGCPGVGEKTAVKLITEFDSIDNLLANKDKLKGALLNKITENEDKILLSRKLAVISKDVPTKIEIEKLEKKEINGEELKKIFDELEFRTLLNKFLPDTADSKTLFKTKSSSESPKQRTKDQKQQNGQNTPNLFDLFAAEGTEDNFYAALEGEKTGSKEGIDLNNEQVRADFIAKSFVEKILNLDVLDANQPYIPYFRDILEDSSVEKVSMNIKQRIKDYAANGNEIKGELFDTTVAQYVLQPEIRPRTDFPVESLPEVKTKLESQLKGAEAYELFHEIEMPLVPVLAEMEMEGVCIDTESLAETAKQFNNRLAEIEKTIYEQAGQQFNIQSPKQVGDILFGQMRLIEKPKKTKTGQFVTSEEVLNSLKAKHPIVENILKYRGLKKLVGTYVEALPKLINPKTGHIHTSFNQTVTATGRLSSSDPNLQNIPIRSDDGKDIRRAFVARVGEEFFSADYSQIELRIMAHLSGDKNMIEAFFSGHDIHAATAAKIYKKDISEVTKDERRKAKSANFGIIYGISAWGLAEGLSIDRKEAKALIEGYFESFPQVKDFIDRQIENVRAKGYAETMYHRRRYLPDITSGNATVRSFAERNAVNAPIQGTAADIMKLAMVRIHKRMKEEGLLSKLILQVHDELNFTVALTEKERLERLVIEEMQSVCKMQVPLIADSGWGKNWLEAH